MDKDEVRKLFHRSATHEEFASEFSLQPDRSINLGECATLGDYREAAKELYRSTEKNRHEGK